MAKMNATKLEPAANPDEKKVKIKIPLTRKETEPVFVGMNGRTFLIQRGVEVEVPEGVAEILKNREEVLAQIIEFESQANKIADLK